LVTRILARLALASCVLAWAATARPQAIPRRTTDSVEHFLRDEMLTRRIPGLQAAVVRGGKIVFSGAYGLANIQDSVPVTRRTLFTINSITKAFVGVAVMQLVEAGQVELDRSIGSYLDDLPDTWRRVTVRQLLTNVSGLPNIMNNNTGALVDDGEDAAWAKIRTVPLEFAPGERFSYSQTNYGLIGRLIDTLTGMSFRAFIDARQLRVVGMSRTSQGGFADSRDIIPSGARGYTFFRPAPGGDLRRTDTLGNVFEEFPPSLRTAASMSSTADEMAQWLIALTGGRLFKNPSSIKELWTAARLNDGTTAAFSRFLNGYALGWEVAERPAHRAITALGGARSALFVYPDDDLAVIILTNLQGSAPESMIDCVARHFVSGIPCG
jgi:CubicO group peptidase (beta-lactamase class C family)